MIVNTEAAQVTLVQAEQRIRELREEENTALYARNYAAATSAARSRMLWQERYDQALSAILRGVRE